MDDKKWICTGVFSYAGDTYTIWVRPMYKHADYTQHFESKVEKSTAAEVKEAMENHGPEYFAGFNSLQK